MMTFHLTLQQSYLSVDKHFASGSAVGVSSSIKYCIRCVEETETDERAKPAQAIPCSSLRSPYNCLRRRDLNCMSLGPCSLAAKHEFYIWAQVHITSHVRQMVYFFRGGGEMLSIVNWHLFALPHVDGYQLSFSMRKLENLEIVCGTTASFLSVLPLTVFKNNQLLNREGTACGVPAVCSAQKVTMWDLRSITIHSNWSKTKKASSCAQNIPVVRHVCDWDVLDVFLNRFRPLSLAQVKSNSNWKQTRCWVWCSFVFSALP